jgi:hypothetical protein
LDAFEFLRLRLNGVPLENAINQIRGGEDWIIQKGKSNCSIEIYAEYAESDTPLHIIPNNDGELISKVYDTAYAANYQLTRVEGALSNIDDIDIYVRGCRRDTTHEVWTKWYKEALDKKQETSFPHIFENYQLFQFKIVLKKSDAHCSIRKYILEVV